MEAAILYWETTEDGRPTILRTFPNYHRARSTSVPGQLIVERAQILMKEVTAVTTSFGGQEETFGLQAAWYWQGDDRAAYDGIFYSKDVLAPAEPGAPQEPAFCLRHVTWTFEPSSGKTTLGSIRARDVFPPLDQEASLISLLQEARSRAQQGISLTSAPSLQTEWRDIWFHIENEELEYTLSYNPLYLTCLTFESWCLATFAQFDRCVEQGGGVPDPGASVELTYTEASLSQVLSLHRDLTGVPITEY